MAEPAHGEELILSLLAQSVARLNKGEKRRQEEEVVFLKSKRKKVKKNVEVVDVEEDSEDDIQTSLSGEREWKEDCSYVKPVNDLVSKKSKVIKDETLKQNYWYTDSYKEEKIAVTFEDGIVSKVEDLKSKAEHFKLKEESKVQLTDLGHDVQPKMEQNKTTESYQLKRAEHDDKKYNNKAEVMVGTRKNPGGVVRKVTSGGVMKKFSPEEDRVLLSALDRQGEGVSANLLAKQLGRFDASVRHRLTKLRTGSRTKGRQSYSLLEDRLILDMVLGHMEGELEDFEGRIPNQEWAGLVGQLQSRRAQSLRSR